MGGFFIPRQWRLPKIVYFLLLLEGPFTVANLALFGIASPNLYRTILWSEGGKMGYNSDPSTVLYAAANYRPVKTPLVWSSFMTQYNLVIGVLTMFFYLVKCTMWLLHVFYPIISLPLHLALTAIWAYSLYVQTAPDTIDPERQNHGAPWYITKNCNIVQDKNVKAYCMQAKSAFAVSVIMLAIMAGILVLSIYSLYPTPAARLRHEEKQAEKRAQREKWAAASNSPYDNEMTAEEQWQHMWELQQLPRTPGTAKSFATNRWGEAPLTPITPRTRAFNSLEGEMGVRQQHVPAPASYYGNEKVAGLGVGLHQQEGYQYPPPPPRQTEMDEFVYDGKGKGTAY